MSLIPDWLTGYNSANADAAAAADAQLQQLNQQDYSTPVGKYYSASNAKAVADQRASELASGGYGTAAQRSQIDSAFTTTLDAQAKSIIGGPLGIVWATIKSVLGALPWWLWLGAGFAAFIWLGGGSLLKGSLAKGKK